MLLFIRLPQLVGPAISGQARQKPNVSVSARATKRLNRPAQAATLVSIEDRVWKRNLQLSTSRRLSESTVAETALSV
jgi:hypothetical protein